MTPHKSLRDRIIVPRIRLVGYEAAMERAGAALIKRHLDGEPPGSMTVSPADAHLYEPLLGALIVEPLLDHAAEALESRDVEWFLGYARSNEHCIPLVVANVALLKELDLYEEAVLAALIASRTNNYAYRSAISVLLNVADRTKLRSAGDPLPGAGPFTLFRGVAGRGPARRVRGMSWTASLKTARWFATRFDRLANPAVYSVRVSAEHVIAYTNGRHEQEFLILLPKNVRPKPYQVL